MAESVDARDLKSLGRKVVWVQVPLCAPELILLGFLPSICYNKDTI